MCSRSRGTPLRAVGRARAPLPCARRGVLQTVGTEIVLGRLQYAVVHPWRVRKLRRTSPRFRNAHTAPSQEKPSSWVCDNPVPPIWAFTVLVCMLPTLQQHWMGSCSSSSHIAVQRRRTNALGSCERSCVQFARSTSTLIQKMLNIQDTIFQTFHKHCLLNSESMATCTAQWPSRRAFPSKIRGTALVPKMHSFFFTRSPCSNGEAWARRVHGWKVA